MIKIHNNDDDGLIIIIWDNPNIYWAINSSQTPFYGTIKSISGLSNQNTIYRHIYFLAINNLFIWWSISFVWLVWTQTTRLFSISRSSRSANLCVFHHMKIEWKWVFWRWFLVGYVAIVIKLLIITKSTSLSTRDHILGDTL